MLYLTYQVLASFIILSVYIVGDALRTLLNVGELGIITSKSRHRCRPFRPPAFPHGPAPKQGKRDIKDVVRPDDHERPTAFDQHMKFRLIIGSYIVNATCAAAMSTCSQLERASVGMYCWPPPGKVACDRLPFETLDDLILSPNIHLPSY